MVAKFNFSERKKIEITICNWKNKNTNIGTSRNETKIRRKKSGAGPSIKYIIPVFYNWQTNYYTEHFCCNHIVNW